LVDGQKNGVYGGSGVTADWDFCRALRDRRFTILAGGIGAHNVEPAIAHARPDAVDLCSAVEKSPGLKDHQKLREFFITLESIEYDHGRLTDGFFTLS
jgi:phosphoribosylanthranilate isomerase